MTASVTFTGLEVALVAGMIARAMPSLDEPEWEVADLLLERTLSGFDHPVAPDLMAKVDALREHPVARSWRIVSALGRSGEPFTALAAGTALGMTVSEAFLMLERLALRHKTLRRVDTPEGPSLWSWIIKEED